MSVRLCQTAADFKLLFSPLNLISCYSNGIDRPHRRCATRLLTCCWLHPTGTKPGLQMHCVSKGCPLQCPFPFEDSDKGCPYSITERRVPELIPVHGSQPAGDVSHKLGDRLPLLSARPAVAPQPFRGLLPILLVGEQRHNGCEQFASDCYPTASRLRFEPGFGYPSNIHTVPLGHASLRLQVQTASGSV